MIVVTDVGEGRLPKGDCPHQTSGANDHRARQGFGRSTRCSH
jgi:hypothetical protein